MIVLWVSPHASNVNFTIGFCDVELQRYFLLSLVRVCPVTSYGITRIGRVLIAQGRDAADVPITHTFGPNTLVSFKVWTNEVS